MSQPAEGLVSPLARVAESAEIGAAVVIHDGTVVSAGCVIEDGAVLGKRPRLRVGSRARGHDLGDLEIEDGATICCGAVVYAGSHIGARTIVGDQTLVREDVTIGPDSVVGRGSAVEFGARIGARVLIQTDVYVTAGSVVEDDVFLGPCVVTTNDDTMGRHPPGEALRAPVFGRACRIGGGAVFVPGVVVGAEAFVAAGAVVTEDVPERAVVMGVPARVVREVGDEDLIERWR